MGEFEVTESALYGASTARAVENFPISDLKFSRTFIRSLAEIKKACALVNQKNKLLETIGAFGSALWASTRPDSSE